MANLLQCFHEAGYKRLYELGVVQICYSLLFLYFFGWLKGLLYGIFFYYVFYIIMDNLGYEMIKGIDAISAIEIDPINVRNCASYMKMDRVTRDELLDRYFYPKGVLKFRRLRQVWVRKFGLWFFKDIDPTMARGQVKKIEENMSSQEDINNYMAKIMATDMDTSKPLWEVHVKEDYDENTSIVFILVHHLLSDGMGIMTLFTFMNDINSPDNISHHRKIPFLAYYVLPLIYLPLGFFRFVVAGITCKGDPNMYPFSLKNQRQSRNKIYLESKEYELDDLRKCYNNFGKMKLNDYLFASISAAFSRYFKELGINNQTHFSLSVPINMKPLPSTLEEVQFNNSCSLCLANIPISTDLAYVMKKAREYFDPGFSLVCLRFGQFVVSFMGFLPEALSRFTIIDNSKSINTVISNTPGPSKPITFCDQKVKSIGGVGPNIGCSGLTILIASYCGTVKLQVLADKNLNMDAKRFMTHLESQLDDCLNLYAS